MSVTAPSAIEEQQAARNNRVDLNALLRSEGFLLAAGLALAMGFAFWPFLAELPKDWFAPDTYYAHGSIVPLCALYVLYDRWPRIKVTPAKGSWLALALILPFLYLAFIAGRTTMMTVLSGCFVAVLVLGVAFVGGWRWAWKTAPATLYLLFGLPVWRPIIDRFTPPLQWLSTDAAYVLLKLSGLRPFRTQPNVVELPNYTLDVAEACSGLKTVLAVVAIAVFFMFIARLKPWANLTLAAIAVPLSILVNGIRIALIGVVGNAFGEAAGAQFHDYSGYIALVLCFALLYGTTRKLGWK